MENFSVLDSANMNREDTVRKLTAVVTPAAIFFPNVPVKIKHNFQEFTGNDSNNL